MALHERPAKRFKTIEKSDTASERPTARPNTGAKAGRSNRPKPDTSSSSSPESDRDAGDSDDDRQAMLAALERHQAAFLSEAAPNLIKSAPSGNRSEKRGRAPVPVKPVWEMTMDDLEDEEDDSGDEDSQDGDEIEVSITSTSGGSQRRVPEVAVFQDPSRASANVETSFYNFGDDTTPDQSAGTKKAMRDFMSSTVKSLHKKESVADAANAKRKPKTKAAPAAGLDPEEEAHLASLDSHLSNLIRPLTQPSTAAPGSQLPQLLSDLPLAPTKTLKGHTPLPKNAPRTMRAGQAAANLKRARKRDEAAGVVAGAARGVGGREALTKKEKRLEDEGGEIKRQRGLGGAVGRLGGGELRLSKSDIEKGMTGGGAFYGGGERRSDGPKKGGKGGKGKNGRR